MNIFVKRIIPVLFVLTISIHPTVAQQAPSYERDSESLKGWQVPNNYDPENLSVSLDINTRHGGRASALLWARDPLATKIKSTLFLKQAFKADKYLNKRVRFSLFAKAENVRSAIIWMRMEGANAIAVNDDRMNESNEIKGTLDWRKYEIVLDVPSRSLDITFGVSLWSAGRLWVDDVTFEVVPQSTETTSVKTPEMIEAASIKSVEEYKVAYKSFYEKDIEYSAAKLKTMPIGPLNLGFEN